MMQPGNNSAGASACSAVVLSSAAQIQSLESVVRCSLQPNDTLLDPDFFLASVTEGWTPRVVAVRHGSELAGVVFAKERSLLGHRLGVVYADLTFGSLLLGDPPDQQAAFLSALETLLRSEGTHGIRLRVRRGGPELAAVRSLIGARRLDVHFTRVKDHASLRLPGTYEELLRSFGSTTRHNFRYYRRRFESAGHVYLEDLPLDAARLAALYLEPRCSIPSRHNSIDRVLRMVAAADRPLAVGLRHRNGEWLSVVCGVTSVR